MLKVIMRARDPNLPVLYRLLICWCSDAIATGGKCTGPLMPMPSDSATALAFKTLTAIFLMVNFTALYTSNDTWFDIRIELG